MPNPKLTITREPTFDDDGEVDDHRRELSVEISDGYVYVELEGDEYDDNANIVEFYHFVELLKPEARQLRDFLNANLKD